MDTTPDTAAIRDIFRETTSAPRSQIGRLPLAVNRITDTYWIWRLPPTPQSRTLETTSDVATTGRYSECKDNGPTDFVHGDVGHNVAVAGGEKSGDGQRHVPITATVPTSPITTTPLPASTTPSHLATGHVDGCRYHCDDRSRCGCKQ